MKITFIKPPAYGVGLMGVQRVPHLGIAYIAAAARDEGHEVDVIDMCGEDIDRVELLRGKYLAYGMPVSALDTRLKPSRVIGFTVMFSQDWVFIREIIDYVRKLAPDALLVAGGEHVTAVPDYCLSDCPALDVCVVGEGEEALVSLLDATFRGDDLSTVGSLVYRAPDGSVKHTARRNRIKGLDQLPLPAWDLIPVENYLSRGLNYHLQRGRTMPMLATRGCPYKCTFCSNPNMWGTAWLPRDPKLVVDEVELYIKQYGATNFIFSDLTAVIKKRVVVDFCREIIRRKLDVTWQLPTTRSEALDLETLMLMHKAGCRELDFAIESASAEVIKSVLKNNNAEKMSQAIKDALSIEMNLAVNIIIGLPGEGLRDFFKSYFMSLRLAVMGLQELNCFPFTPYPGSQLFFEFIKAGRLRLDDKFFLDLYGYADLSKAVSWSDRFSPRGLRFLRLFLMSSFYSVMFLTHPRRIVRLLTNVLRGDSTTKLEGVVKRIARGARDHRAAAKAI